MSINKNLVYKQKYIKRDNIQYFEFDEPRNDFYFGRDIMEYCNALINSNGGLLLFGVRNGNIIGIHINREKEDAYRLNVDRQLRNFEPPIGPNSYRINVIPLAKPHASYCVFEVRISAGPMGSLYQTKDMEVFTVKNGKKIGPLWPQELKAFVIEKYEEEMRASKELVRTPGLTPSVTGTKSGRES